MKSDTRSDIMARLLILITCLVGLWAPASAQNPYAAARVVNDRIISNWDVDQRVRLYRAFGFTPSQPRELALEELTQDKLKLQAADSIGASVTDEGLDDAIAQYAAQRQMSVGGMRARLNTAGVAEETFNEFLRTSLLWRAVIDARFRRRAAPSEEDLRSTLELAASSPTESVFLREIAIPFAERGQQGARDLADRIIRQVRGGANFSALAREFSRSRTAQAGGSIGWTSTATLPAQMATEVLTLTPGEVTGKIEIPAGIIVLQVVDIREETNLRPDAFVTYVRYDLPPADTGALATLLEQATEFQSCLDAELAAEGFGGQSGLVGPLPAASLSGEIAMTIATLDAGETGAAMLTAEAQSVIYLCSRGVDIDPEATEALRVQIFNQRMNAYAAGYLQELLADAVVDEG